MNKHIFIPVVGQFTNVGDVMHRKELISWFKRRAILHVYIGCAPKSFVNSLELEETAITYTSITKWLLSIIKHINRQPSFIFNPGEINLRNKRLIGEIGLVPFTLLIRMFGGKVIRVGIAAKQNKTKLKFLWRCIFKISNKIYWRTLSSHHYFNIGKVIPDLAFAEKVNQLQNSTQKLPRRSLLTISMRFDRPAPSEKWYKAIKNVADFSQLDICVISQVKMDNERSKQIANHFGVNPILWKDEDSHKTQENAVRKEYSKTKLLISDRLHVLIAGTTEMALPSVILTANSSKINDHFDVIDYGGISINENESTLDELIIFLKKQFTRERELSQKSNKASAHINKVSEGLKEYMKI